MSILFSATFPQRTSGLIILYGAMARSAWAVDYPWGQTAEHSGRMSSKRLGDRDVLLK
jgi:hypothetical protein